MDVERKIALIEQRKLRISVIGLGYVGLPLAILACNAGFNVLGLDIDPDRVQKINLKQQVIGYMPVNYISDAIESGRFYASTEFKYLKETDAIIICVPTPLTKHREPDLSFIENTARTIAVYMKSSHIIILESTTWPGTTEQVVKPILEAGGLRSGRDFYLAFSPEREDPGNGSQNAGTIPKVVGGHGADALRLAKALYDTLFIGTVPVSSPATAEAVKLTENIFRAVNVALVNELKVIYQKMGIDIWEVVEAAKTKPFGYMPFYPGPGLGGHCIPIDPFYLTWKAREYDVTTRFIELAGQINTAMPYYVIDRLAEALDRSAGRGLRQARVLVIGVAYKKNVDDVRESPALRLIEILEARGAAVEYHDPHIPVIPMTREHAALAGRCSVGLSDGTVEGFDVVLIATDHEALDYAGLAARARLVVDTRNACGRAGVDATHVVKA